MTFDPDRSLLFVPPSTQDRIKGVLNATVVLVMYGDYECSQSADVYRLIKVIGRQLSISLGENYLCFIFRHFPQIEIHSHAQRAAEATEAAAVQGQFWPMHKMLFDHQQELGNGYLVEYANNLGLDISQFLQDISKKVYIDCINEDIESGLHSGVTSAPALFINGIRYSNRWTVKQIMAAIVAANN
ncbi:DsbA family protein [Nostoc sp. TCL240-02]|uniref:DsbA family protein n=1 Tax=Nostoc sp. TCL240-02 TaxID=2572090 RepID=UPI0020C5CAB4|nr:DsbA family protein [Nostoc sp. TCL240-02]